MAVALAAGSLLALGSTSCSDDKKYDNPSGETNIYTIAIANGGLSGADIINGEIDQESNTMEFTIPAETDIQAIRFSGRLSLGASFDQDTYDFYTSDASTLTGDVKIVNVDNSEVYHVVLHLADPVATPVLNSITVKNDAGALCKGFVSDANNTLYLNCEGSATAEISEVNLLPRRSTYTFTAATNGVLSADNPGQIIMEFGGRTATMNVEFGGSPVFGADFSMAEAFSRCTSTGNVYADYVAENTRWTQFDGRNLLVVSREGGTNPKTISYSSIIGGSPSDNVLDITGIAGGTFTVSAGGFANGHIYVCNLTTDMPATPFKLYHWSSTDAPCELLFETTGSDDFKGRWGDNMSVTLDENGDGYIWLFDHAGGAFCQRFPVTGYTQIGDPVRLDCPYTVAYYASINPVDGEENRYMLTSATQQTILLVDSDLNVYNRIEAKEGADYPVVAEADARIIKYNGERYMITCSAWGWMYRYAQTIRVYDLSQGGDTQLAITNFNTTNRMPVYSFEIGGANCSAYSASSGASIDDDGNLVLMGAAPRGGFAIIRVPRKR